MSEYDGVIKRDMMEHELMVNLPEELLEELGWREDDQVEIDEVDGCIIIRNVE